MSDNYQRIMSRRKKDKRKVWHTPPIISMPREGSLNIAPTDPNEIMETVRTPKQEAARQRYMKEHLIKVSTPSIPTPKKKRKRKGAISGQPFARIIYTPMYS